MEQKLEDMLTCSVCQEIFEDPQQLPCGHSMCLGCLQNLRDHSMDTPFRCPNCRQYFGQVIRISKSYTLTNIAEEYRELRRSKGRPDVKVCCDCCPEKENLAEKTCVKCEVSFCNEHIKDHLTRAAFADHPLVKPLPEVLKRKCPVHRDEVARHYCGKSGSYVCKLCTTESNQLNVAKMVSGVIQTPLEEHRQHADLRFKLIKNQVSEVNQSIKTLREDIQRELSHFSDAVRQFQETTKPKVHPPDSPANSVTVVLFCLFLMVLIYAYSCSVENQALTEAQKDQQNRIHRIYATIAEQLLDHPINSHLPPLTKNEVLMLDLDTANDYIKISNDLRTAKKVRKRIGYPSILTRFEEAPQVLSAHCFRTGTHVWEVQVEGYWDIAVSFRSIKHERKSRSAFGNNPHSWSLTHSGSGKLVAYHDGKKTAISATLEGNHVAVMVDIEKGNITFASMDATMARLHEFQAKLTQPVCLGFGLYRIDPPSIASIVKAW